MSSALKFLLDKGTLLKSKGGDPVNSEVEQWENSVIDLISFIWGQYAPDGTETKEYQLFAGAATLEAKLEALTTLLHQDDQKA